MALFLNSLPLQYRTNKDNFNLRCMYVYNLAPTLSTCIYVGMLNALSFNANICSCIPYFGLQVLL